MRLTELRRNGVLLVVVGLAVAAATAAGLSTLRDGAESTAGREEPASPAGVAKAPVAASPERALELKEGTRRRLGSFTLRSGRVVGVLTAETVDGRDCLLTADDTGEGSSCLEGGLFALRNVEFLVASEGGPDRFRELRVAGIVAPGIRSLELVRTDGSMLEIRPGPGGAFLFESSASELERSIYPAGFRVFGPGGRLVETVRFPVTG